MRGLDFLLSLAIFYTTIYLPCILKERGLFPMPRMSCCS